MPSPTTSVRLFGSPVDAYFDKQWGMNKVQAPQAWDVTTGSGEVNIAILDTGIDLDHPDLAAKIVSSINFGDSPNADDSYGHGTHCAGIAAASTNNGVGVAGLGYDSTLMNVKVLRDNGSGYYSWVANGITWAADNGAEVISLSLGGSSASSTLENAINYAWDKGVVIVTAAGNNGNSNPFYPAYYANCIAVAGTDANDNLAPGPTMAAGWMLLPPASASTPPSRIMAMVTRAAPLWPRRTSLGCQAWYSPSSQILMAMAGSMMR